MRLGTWGVRQHMVQPVQPVQLCNPAIAAGGQGDGVCSEASVAGMLENARANDCVPELGHLCLVERDGVPHMAIGQGGHRQE